ncbi:MAG: SurA N-terminal domain-containing protein [Candidatus Omnitrophica bacterium]|nr:SurA N-terminal domain-containing protein [Candidatus Omnitrophota bacterium]
MVMKFFRKKKNMKIILWTIAILIIPGFLIWGVGVGGGDKGRYYAAVVNREPITLREYHMSLGEVEGKYREIFGEKAAELFKNMNIEHGVLESMIRDRILIQQAKRRRIRVFDSEIVDVIKSEPVFLDEKGRFDEAKYRQIISGYPTEELRKIEDELRVKIMTEKLKELLIAESGVEVSDEEVAQYIKTHQITEKDGESIRRTLLWQKREQFFNQWYAETRKNANVKIYLSFEEPPAAAEQQQGAD